MCARVCMCVCARSQPHLAATAPGGALLPWHEEGADRRRRPRQPRGRFPIQGSQEPLCLAYSPAWGSSSSVTSTGPLSGGFGAGILSGCTCLCLPVGSPVPWHTPLPNAHSSPGTCPRLFLQGEHAPRFSSVYLLRFTPAAAAGCSLSMPDPTHAPHPGTTPGRPGSLWGAPAPRDPTAARMRLCF